MVNVNFNIWGKDRILRSNAGILAWVRDRATLRIENCVSPESIQN
jgi:hypothetical protein